MARYEFSCSLIPAQRLSYFEWKVNPKVFSICRTIKEVTTLECGTPSWNEGNILKFPKNSGDRCTDGKLKLAVQSAPSSKLALLRMESQFWILFIILRQNSPPPIPSPTHHPEGTCSTSPQSRNILVKVLQTTLHANTKKTKKTLVYNHWNSASLPQPSNLPNPLSQGHTLQLSGLQTLGGGCLLENFFCLVALGRCDGDHIFKPYPTKVQLTMSYWHGKSPRPSIP